MSLFNKDNNSSPTHYTFLVTIISIKDQYQLKEDLEEILNTEIFVERQNGCALFQCDSYHQEECISYCQLHMYELITKYNLKKDNLEG